MNAKIILPFAAIAMLTLAGCSDPDTPAETTGNTTPTTESTPAPTTPPSTPAVAPPASTMTPAPEPTVAPPAAETTNTTPTTTP